MGLNIADRYYRFFVGRLGAPVRRATILFSALMLSGCTTVDVHYAKLGAFDDGTTAADNAKAGLSYFALARIHIAVAPQEDASSSAPKQDGGNTSSGNSGQANQGTSHGSSDDTAEVASTDISANSTEASKKKKKKKTQTTKKTDDAAPDASGTVAAANDKDTPAGSDQTHSSNPIATIDGKIWGATLSAQDDTTKAFMAGGNSGFWNETTVSGTKVSNSDRPQAISVKAQNLVAKRLGQITTVLGYLTGRGGGGDNTNEATETGTGPEPLKPFDFDVTYASLVTPAAVKVPGTKDWTYELQVDDAKPQGAVTFSTFIDDAVAADKVNYFPVPACMPGHLTLKRTATAVSGQTTIDTDSDVTVEFPVVVAVPDVVRLEPLPIDGKLTLSSVCSSSRDGATTTNQWDDFFAALAAVQENYQKATKPKSDASQGGDKTGDQSK